MLENLTMSNKTYDILAIIARLILPFSDFVAAICAIWNLPYALEITGTLTSLEALLQAFLQIVKKNYEKRQAEANYVVIEDPVDEREVDG